MYLALAWHTGNFQIISFPHFANVELALLICCQENWVNSTEVTADLHPSTFKPTGVPEEQLQLVTPIVSASEAKDDDDVYLQHSPWFLKNPLHNLPTISLLRAPWWRRYSWISSWAAILLGLVIWGSWALVKDPARESCILWIPNRSRAIESRLWQWGSQPKAEAEILSTIWTHVSTDHSHPWDMASAPRLLKTLLPWS